MKKIRWGLLGAGVILNDWLNGFHQLEDAQIVGIASRTRETAEKKACQYGISESMTYDEMLSRKDIDAVYIPVPHTAHKELAIRALEAGIAVMVEKPAAVTAADWREMVSCARKNHVFLMEAVWTRCFPAMQSLKKEIDSGIIGDIRCVQSEFCFRIPDDYQGRLTDPMTAGGALLDVGVYNLHFADLVFGHAPLRWASLASIGSDNVDEQAGYIGQYENGALAILTSAIRTTMVNDGWIYGTKGYIKVPREFYMPDRYEITVDRKTETRHFPIPQRVEGINDKGYQFEISHMQECLREGLTESPVVTHAMTESVLLQCDILREQWGLKYPFENLQSTANHI
ncbi:MAG: Gfo/Idh/MocA family oxidoreductase [Anaerolineaceae bacterium]|nr:Gfo/Idh/MocA family oxidoreductase [Anaerolineaceae bacterium]